MTSLVHARGVAMVVVVFLLLAGLLASPAQAQGPSGRVTGRITDAATGAPLPFANVTVLGTPYGNISSQTGEYLIEFVPVGSYVVQATYMGYTGKRSETIAVAADRSTQLNFALKSEVLQAAEVLVTAERPMIETERHDDAADDGAGRGEGPLDQHRGRGHRHSAGRRDPRRADPRERRARQRSEDVRRRHRHHGRRERHRQPRGESLVALRVRASVGRVRRRVRQRAVGRHQPPDARGRPRVLRRGHVHDR